MARLYVMLLLTLFSLTLSPMLRAQSAADRDALYQAAKVDLQAGRAAVALEKLQRGLAAGIEDHELRWTYRLAIAVAHDAMGNGLAVLEDMQRLEKDLKAGDQHVPSAWRARLGGMYQRVAELQARFMKTHGGLHIVSQPPGAKVYLDGMAAGESAAVFTPFTLYVEPGPHRVRLELDGYEADVRTVRIETGVVEDLEVTLATVPPPSPVLAPIEPTPEEAPPEPLGDIETEAQRARSAWLDPTWGWIMTGTGAAVLLAGIPFTVMAYDDYQDMQKYSDDASSHEDLEAYRDARSSKKNNEGFAVAMYGMGATIAAGGAAWLIVAYTSDAASDDIQAGFVPLEGGAVMTFSGRF